MINSRPLLSIILLSSLAVFASSLHGQDADQQDVSSMQWANAASVSGIKFTLLGDLVADPWKPGGQVGAGRRETLHWSAEFTPTSGGDTLKESLELEPGQSGAAVLVGDFAEADETLPPAKLPPGYSKLDGDKLLRAALLRFPVGKDRETQYPVHLVNADPKSRVKVTAAGASYELQYAVPQSFKAPAGQHVKIQVSATGLEKEMGFTLEPYNRGCIIAFYRPADADRTSFVFVNLRSLESIAEIVQAQSRVESMEEEAESQSE
jgi:hypothetical protein